MSAFVLGPIFCPSKRISPLVGRIRPAIIFIIVVLPLPLGPSSAYVLPGSMVIDTLFTASFELNLRVT